MARRVSAIGILVEYTSSDIKRRVSAIGVLVEYGPTYIQRRTSAIGVEVEYYGGEHIIVSGIPSEEAFGMPTLPAGIITISPTGIPSEESVSVGRVRIINYPPVVPLSAAICDSLASYYYVLLCDVYGNVIALFDDFEKLEYANNVDDIGYFSLTLRSDDSRIDLFELDGIVRVLRSVPGLGLDWYDDFVGLYRTPMFEITEDGKEVFTAIGVSTNDLLLRTSIGYKAGTIRAAKNAPSETCIKEYVTENCGVGATIANGRQSDAVLPNFQVEGDLGAGDTWSGDMAGANLLDTIQDISMYSGIDFGVEFDGDSYIFKTYNDQFGQDRTTLGLDVSTGKNSAGNFPVIFSTNFSNIKSLKYVHDRVPEFNRVFMLGKGDGSTRVWQTVTASSIFDSIYNRREVSRNGSSQEFLYQLTQMGVDELSEGAARIQIGFSPYQQPSCTYGVHYNTGDRVSLIFRGVTLHYKLMGCRVTVSAGEESLNIVFSEGIMV